MEATAEQNLQILLGFLSGASAKGGIIPGVSCSPDAADRNPGSYLI